ncbi:MAG: hypothetical protein HY909_06900 [Deltaproteobacteria bacterium]|nr:hypothetical protein [Deltaproteobacteria bacterium]
MTAPRALRTLPWALALGLGLGACACSTARPRALTERIAGAPRQRAFASPTAYEAYLRAELASARGDDRSAARQSELAVTADPTDGFLQARRAELLHRTDPNGALSLALEASRTHPDSAAVWLVLAELRQLGGDAPGAREALDHALALDPEDPDVGAASVRLSGGTASQEALAREAAGDARTPDRLLAARLVLDPGGMLRRRTRALLRQRSRSLAERGAWRQVDRVLGPLLDAGAAAVQDRVLLIEARALSGRTEDAAVLVAGLPVGSGPEAVSRAERARLWALTGHCGEALEEATQALQENSSDSRSRVVRGRCLTHLGRTPEGLLELGQIVPQSPDFAEARVLASEALVASGVEDLVVDAVLERAQGQAGDGLSRDRLRVARATLRARGGGVGAPAEALAGVETVWGRHRRGALLAPTEAPSRVLEDLQARSGEPFEDAQADAWVVLVSRLHPEALGADAVTAALARAREGAPEAAVTLRASASQSADRREATELLRRAWAQHRAR